MPALEGRTIEVAPVAIGDDAIDAELDTLRSRFGTLVTVDRPAAKGDFVTLDLVATIDGAEVDRLLEQHDEQVSGRHLGIAAGARQRLGGGERLLRLDCEAVSLHRKPK